MVFTMVSTSCLWESGIASLDPLLVASNSDLLFSYSCTSMLLY